MQLHDLQQHTAAWHEFRAKSFGASDAPAMMGKSKYQTRNDLLKLKHTGIAPDVDDVTQHRFDQGHAAEIGGRAIAEGVIGEQLSPVVVSEQLDGLLLSASLDGMNFDGDIIFEHKLYNEELAAAVRAGMLQEMYTIQMDQQLLISGAAKCLFVCSDGTENKCAWMWYETNRKKCDSLIVGWLQFAKDLEAYVPQEFIPAPKADAIMQLPAVIINVTGQLAACNLNEVTPRFDKFLAEAKTTLITDEDFANGEETAKFSRATAKTLKMKADEVISQIASIGEATSTLKLYAEKFDALGLKLEKLVKSEKENRKSQIVTGAQQSYQRHMAGLQIEIGNTVTISIVPPDFAGAIKGKKRLDAMQDAVDTALANGKIEADFIARDIRAKLAWYKSNAKNFEFLFNDLALIITKQFDDFQLLVTTRIGAHRLAKAAEEEATRQRIQAEEEAKAKAKAAAEQEAILAAERTRIQAEERAKATEEAKAQQQRAQQEAIRLSAVAEEHTQAQAEAAQQAVLIPQFSIAAPQTIQSEATEAAVPAESEVAAALPPAQSEATVTIPTSAGVARRTPWIAESYPGTHKILEGIMHIYKVNEVTAKAWITRASQEIRAAA